MYFGSVFQSVSYQYQFQDTIVQELQMYET